MKNAIRSAVAFALLLTLSSCLESEIVIKVKPDGSGEVTERVFIEKQYVQQMRMMGMAYSAQKGKPGGQMDIFDKRKIKQNAAKMGEGVTVKSVEKILTDKGEGYLAVYSFSDINKLTMGLDMSDRIGFDPTKGLGEKKKPKKNEKVTFHLTKGFPSNLVVTTPPKKFGDKPLGANLPMMGKSKGVEQNEMAFNMMRNIVKTLRISFILEPVGKIVETNATYRTGSRITLMEVDFGKLTKDRAKFNKFRKANPKNSDEAKKLLAETEGIKAELKDVINIKFN